MIPLYNFLKYSKNCAKTSGGLWNYHRDKPSSGAVGNISYSIKNSKSFDYKIIVTGKLQIQHLK